LDLGRIAYVLIEQIMKLEHSTNLATGNDEKRRRQSRREAGNTKKIAPLCAVQALKTKFAPTRFDHLHA
jgi:hypothetical protein